MLSIFMCSHAYALSDVSKTLPTQAGDYTDIIDGLHAVTMKGTRLYNFIGTVTTLEGNTAYTQINLALINDAKLMFHNPILNVISTD